MVSSAVVVSAGVCGLLTWGWCADPQAGNGVRELAGHLAGDVMSDLLTARAECVVGRAGYFRGNLSAQSLVADLDRSGHVPAQVHAVVDRRQPGAMGGGCIDLDLKHRGTWLCRRSVSYTHLTLPTSDLV